MLEPDNPIARLASEDGRYHIEAYRFVFESLAYAQNVLGLGDGSSTEGGTEAGGKAEDKDAGGPPHSGATPEASGEPSEAGESPERHISGPQLCGAIVQLAREQYGFLAKCVFNNWGITSTSDFGEIVFQLINIEQMRKTDADCRADFDNVFDFDEELVDGYRITMPE